MGLAESEGYTVAELHRGRILNFVGLRFVFCQKEPLPRPTSSLSFSSTKLDMSSRPKAVLLKTLRSGHSICISWPKIPSDESAAHIFDQAWGENPDSMVYGMHRKETVSGRSVLEQPGGEVQ